VARHRHPQHGSLGLSPLERGTSKEEEGLFNSGVSHVRLLISLLTFFIFSKKQLFLFAHEFILSEPREAEDRRRLGRLGSTSPFPCSARECVPFDSGTSRSSKAGNDFVRALVLPEPHQIRCRRGLERLGGAGSPVFR
jgi:hypothetical protein